MSNLDTEIFFRRIKRIYDGWNNVTKDEPLGQVDTLIIDFSINKYVTYSKTRSLHTWLFGYELIDLIMLFNKEELHILSCNNNIDFIKSIENVNENQNQDLPRIKLTLRNKIDKDEKNFNKLIEIIKKDRNKKIGKLTNENYTSDFIYNFRIKLKELDYQIIDVSNSFAYIMAVKEENEIEIIKKACTVTVEIFNTYVKSELINIIDYDIKVKHNELSKAIEKTIENKKYTKNLDHSLLEMCYTPIVQSGGNYNLEFSAQNDKNDIHFDTIICGFGTRYKQYCSNIVRTILINPTDEQQKIYEFLLDVEENALEQLVDGAKICDVYNSVINFVQQKDESLVDKLTKNLGSAIGIEFREGSLLITPNNKSRLKKGMVFNLAIGFSPLKNKQQSTDGNSSQYALFISDIVLINDSNTPAQLLTSLCKKKLKNISLYLKKENLNKFKNNLEQTTYKNDNDFDDNFNLDSDDFNESLLNRNSPKTLTTATTITKKSSNTFNENSQNLINNNDEFFNDDFEILIGNETFDQNLNNFQPSSNINQLNRPSIHSTNHTFNKSLGINQHIENIILNPDLITENTNETNQFSRSLSLDDDKQISKEALKNLRRSQLDDDDDLL